MDLPLQTSRRNIIRSIGSDNSPLRKSVAITSTPRAVDVVSKIFMIVLKRSRLRNNLLNSKCFL